YDLFVFMICDFFFSSRRRHTRFSRDWSSDVCSSDLLKTSAELKTDYAYAPDQRIYARFFTGGFPVNSARNVGSAGNYLVPGTLRSEERRVGKIAQERRKRVVKNMKKEVRQTQGSSDK